MQEVSLEAASVFKEIKVGQGAMRAMGVWCFRDQWVWVVSFSQLKEKMKEEKKRKNVGDPIAPEPAQTLVF